MSRAFGWAGVGLLAALATTPGCSTTRKTSEPQGKAPETMAPAPTPAPAPAPEPTPAARRARDAARTTSAPHAPHATRARAPAASRAADPVRVHAAVRPGPVLHDRERRLQAAAELRPERHLSRGLLGPVRQARRGRDGRSLRQEGLPVGPGLLQPELRYLHTAGRLLYPADL